MENKEIKPEVKAEVKLPKLTELEAAIIAKSETFNEPALCAFFGVGHDVVKAALLKR